MRNARERIRESPGDAASSSAISNRWPQRWRKRSLRISRHPGRPAIFAAVAVAALAPITSLMGGTLTLLIGHVVTRDLSVAGRPVGALYGVNALGAALGAFISDFALIPALGIFRTQPTAVSVNGLVGLAALALATRLPPCALATVSEPETILRFERPAFARRRVSCARA